MEDINIERFIGVIGEVLLEYSFLGEIISFRVLSMNLFVEKFNFIVLVYRGFEIIVLGRVAGGDFSNIKKILKEVF